MTGTVLIVGRPAISMDDLQSQLRAIGVHLAVEAVSGEPAGCERVQGQDVVLVLANLEDGSGADRALLDRVLGSCPDIPVLVLAKGCPPGMALKIGERHPSDLLRTPPRPEEMAGEVAAALSRSTEGGTLYGVSPGSFLQTVAVDHRTCTIRVENDRLGRRGALFFVEGELRDARSGPLRGVEAAHQILAWANVNLMIQNQCPPIETRIREGFQAVLLEAMRRKDEEGPSPDGPEEGGAPLPLPEVEPDGTALSPAPGAASPPEAALQGTPGVERIYRDGSWDEITARLEAIGLPFDTGRLRLAYLDQGDPSGHVLLPTVPTTVVRVSRNCPRDLLVQALIP